MTGHIYRDVIPEQHVPLFRGAMGAEFLFMDDNACPHRTNIVDECLQSEDIILMDCPAYSPDLNPIENVEKHSQLIKDGWNDWAHLSHILKTHESSASHLKHSSKCSELKMSSCNLCTTDAAQQRLYDAEKVYTGNRLLNGLLI
ncbi:transposable element Tcb2 transposase [Trichonephila clavipes]|nr:transposable element Tcb2 transposase [Trichonephila clavipes]